MATQAGSMVDRVKESLKSASGRADGVRRAVEAISGSNPLYHWTGVYLLEAGELVLSHEIGKPTPHRRIPLDKGICGAAAREGKTIVVDDVNADPRYLACTLQTRSEIVVPLRSGRRILGEIDIDSDRRAAFTAEDRIEIEGAAEALSEFLHGGARRFDPAETQPVRTRSARTEGP